jgi:hypothetical protein
LRRKVGILLYPPPPPPRVQLCYHHKVCCTFNDNKGTVLSSLMFHLISEEYIRM